MFNINDSFIADDLNALAEILNPVEERTVKLEVHGFGFIAFAEKFNNLQAGKAGDV